eukprot:UN20293
MGHIEVNKDFAKNSFFACFMSTWAIHMVHVPKWYPGS